MNLSYILFLAYVPIIFIFDNLNKDIVLNAQKMNLNKFCITFTLHYIYNSFIKYLFIREFLVFIFCLVNRSHVYIGFAGLFVGSGVGFLIGINVKPSAITVTHMKAASATNYNGTDVIFYPGIICLYKYY